MRLFVDLDADEEAMIHGWVNHYVGHPSELPTKLVLSQRSRARLLQIAAQFGLPAPAPGPKPVPSPQPIKPVDPADPLGRIRLAPSQLTIWRNATDVEGAAMAEIHGAGRVAEQRAFYGPGGPGNVGVRQTGPAAYLFVLNEVWTPEVQVGVNSDGIPIFASDVLVATNAANNGVKVIGALRP